MCARTNLPCDCLRFEGRMRLLTDPAYINKVGKDTGHMFAAGAEPTWWLQTTSEVQIESAQFLHGELLGPKVWIIEGSGPIRAGVADLSILVAKADDSEPKDSWFDLLPTSDVIAISHKDDIDIPSAKTALGRLPTDKPVVHFSGTANNLPHALATLADQNFGMRC